LIKGGVNFLGRSAVLMDFADPLLEVHAGFQGAQHLIGCAEHAIEELELLVQ
jgi:hypothetical protein